MKVLSLFAMMMAVFALFFSAGQTSPAPDPKVPIKKIAKVIVSVIH